MSLCKRCGKVLSLSDDEHDFMGMQIDKTFITKKEKQSNLFFIRYLFCLDCSRDFDNVLTKFILEEL